MLSIFRDLPRPTRVLLALALGLFFVLILGTLVLHELEDWLVLTWQQQDLLDKTAVSMDTFRKGIFDLSVPAEVFFLEKLYKANDLQVPAEAAFYWWAALVLAFSFISAVVAHSRRWVFVGGTATMIFFLVGLRSDLLMIYTTYDKLVPGLLVAVYIALMFFLSINKNLSIQLRVFSFLIYAILAAVLLTSFSQESLPALLMANYASALATVLAVAFILIISTQIPSVLLDLVTRSDLQHRHRKNLRHFFAIMLFYLGNLILLFLKNSKILELDILYVDDLYLLAVSAIVGLWGIQKSPMFAKLFPQQNFAILLYIGLAIICFANIAYAEATMNIPMLAMYEDAVVYSHLAWGLALSAYVFINFYDYKERQPIAEVLFEKQDDKKMPLYISRAFGYLILTAILMKVDMLPYKQAQSGFYNYIADAHLLKEDYLSAKFYYAEATAYDFYNKRSQLALAKIAKKEKNKVAELKALQASLFRDRSPQAFLTLSEQFWQAGQKFEAIFQLQEALQYFPREAALHSNLGYMYAQLGAGDSATYYFNQHKKYASSNEKEVATINLLAYLLQKGLSNDSIFQSFGKSENIEVRFNQLALQNKFSFRKAGTFKKEDFETVLQDSLYNIGWQKFAYLYNYTLNQLGTKDSSSLRYIQSIEQNANNVENFGEQLNFAKACFAYYNQESKKGIEVLTAIAALSPIEYNHILGLWALQHGQLDIAIEHLRKAKNVGIMNVPVRYALAIALTEKGDWAEAQSLWQDLVKYPDATLEMKQKALEIQRIFDKALQSNIEAYDDTEKYGLLYYKQFTDFAMAQRVLTAIKNKDYQIAGAAQLILQALKNKELTQAEQVYDWLLKRSLQTENSWALSELHFASLQLLLAQKNYRKILDSIDQIYLSGIHEYYRTFFRAVAELQAGLSPKTSTYFRKLPQILPFSEEVYVASAQYFEQEGDSQQAYDILVGGLSYLPSSPTLWKSYVQQCLNSRALNYVDSGLERLKTLLSAEEYKAFESNIRKQESEIEALLYGK
jgi:Flp pilus assembly protein TadD